MTLETESGSIIKIIEEQCNGIIEKITHRQASNGTDVQTALKEFIGNPRLSINFNFLGDLSKKLVSSYGKSLSKFSNPIKTEVKSQPAVELMTEAGLSNPLPFNEATEDFNNQPQAKNKVKTRVIDFDEDGKGYVVNKIKRVRKKNFSSYENKNIQNCNSDYLFKNESQFTKDIREAFFFINILRKNEINYNYEKSIKGIFQSFALEEFKSVICKKIYDLKDQSSKNFFYEYNKIKLFLLPNFSDIQSEYRDNFLLLTNFSILEKLAKKADIIADNINTLMPILDDIIKLYSEWNINYEFSEFYIVKDSFNAKFNNNTFVYYLENVIFLLEENKLKLDKISLDFHCEVSNTTLKNIENIKIKINKLRSDLSINRFLKEQQEAIQCYFDKHLQINLDYSQTHTDSLLYKFLIKLYEFILNLFNINFFINNISNLVFFAKKLDIFNLHLDCISVDRIYNEFTLKLTWLEFLKNGINPFFLASISFKKNLSEKLFLYIVNLKFLHTIRFNFPIESFSNGHKLANDLLLIRLSLENAKIGTINDLICFYEKDNINLPKVGEQIIKLLNDNEAFKEYLKALVILVQNTQALNEEFSILCNTTQKNIANTWEIQMSDCFSQHISRGNYLFRLPQTTHQVPFSSRIIHKI